MRLDIIFDPRGWAAAEDRAAYRRYRCAWLLATSPREGLRVREAFGMVASTETAPVLQVKP